MTEITSLGQEFYFSSRKHARYEFTAEEQLFNDLITLFFESHQLYRRSKTLENTRKVE